MAGRAGEGERGGRPGDGRPAAGPGHRLAVGGLALVLAAEVAVPLGLHGLTPAEARAGRDPVAAPSPPASSGSSRFSRGSGGAGSPQGRSAAGAKASSGNGGKDTGAVPEARARSSYRSAPVPGAGVTDSAPSCSASSRSATSGSRR